LTAELVVTDVCYLWLASHQVSASLASAYFTHWQLWRWHRQAGQ